MKTHAVGFDIRTRGKGTYEITDRLEAIAQESGVRTGLLTVFVQHTSASLVIYENADPDAREDLHKFFEDDLAPEDLPGMVHTLEGPDDTTSHLRMALTRTSENIPVQNARLTLGAWQGVFLFEHRHAPHTRRLSVVVIGE